jgi:hypothetical protein
MKLKNLYLDRIKTLRNELKNTNEYILKRQSIIQDYISLINETLTKLKSISEDENIEPHIKYIQLNEKTSEIEKISIQIEILYTEINQKESIFNKEKSILIQNCLEDHSNFSEDEILEEVSNLLSDV